MTTRQSDRRNILGLGAAGLAAAATLDVRKAAAASAPESLLRKVLNRGHLIVGTGSANAPWHFEDANNKLTGMDVAMGKILAKALFGDEKKVKFVLESAAARIPNITTGKVDIVIHFMTISAQRAQLVAFSRPYYIEAVALLTRADAKAKSFDQLAALGAKAKVSILQNVGATQMVHEVLPKAEVMQIDTQANVIQALESHRADAAAVDLSNVRWLVKQAPNRYADAGKAWVKQLYGAAVRQGDPDWLLFVNTVFDVAMFSSLDGHHIYDSAFLEFFGEKTPPLKAGFPSI
ncbi:MAG TPA: transporter substrate-binding domain-containing protein [Acetobacteraceae bacterium]|nr:transporter substrate-binding domain-containing protein [Acetobacteraceae bacterium]